VTVFLLIALLLQPLLPPLQAASQLSQAELEELLAENAKLKQLLSTYKDRLAPEQVREVCIYLSCHFFCCMLLGREGEEGTVYAV
jgi:hypothetical protein